MKEIGKDGVLEKVRLHLGKKPDLVLFRNQSGAVEVDGRWQRYGLTPGASDLIGIRKLLITPALVGMYIGQFSALEAKAPGKKPTPEQRQFLDLVRKFGGYAGWCDSEESAEACYQQWLEFK